MCHIFRGNNVAIACASLLCVGVVTLVQIRCVCIQYAKGDDRLEVAYSEMLNYV